MMPQLTRKILLLLICVLSQNGLAQTIYRTGNPEPVQASPLSGILLAGGGTDNDDAMRWMMQRAGGGDVVVLRASGGDGYNSYFYSELGVTVNSVTTLVIATTEQANSQSTQDILAHADLIFIAGGNQWDYVSLWRNTSLLEILNQLITDKGITIGGTSAGMAVLGEVIFTAENNTVWTSEALGDPYHRRVMLEKDFIAHPMLRHTVTDSHYDRIQGDGQDRRGRHMAFMARMVTDWHMPARGIAATEGTAIAVDEHGKARVFGDPSHEQYAYFLQAYGGAPEVCEQGQRLMWQNSSNAVKAYKIRGDRQGSGWFELADWMHGQGGMWEFWEVANRNLRQEPSGESGRWLRIEVRDARDSTLLDGAWVGLSDPESPSPPTKHGSSPETAKSHSPQQTPVFGTVHFESLNPTLSYRYYVSKEGYFSWDGPVDPSEENLAIRVYLQRDDTSVPSQRYGIDIDLLRLEIYPNPATDRLWIRLPVLSGWDDQAYGQAGWWQIRVLAVDGRMIATQTHVEPTADGIMLHVSHLPAGMYLLEVGDGVRRMVGRFVRGGR